MPLAHSSVSLMLTALVRLHTSSTVLKSTPASQLIPQLPSTTPQHVAGLGSEAFNGTLDSAHAASVPPNQAQAGCRDVASLAQTTRQPTEAPAVAQHTYAAAGGSEANIDLPAQLQQVFQHGKPVVQTDARTEQQNQTQGSTLQDGVGPSASSLPQQHCTATRVQSHSCAAQHSQASTVAYTGATQQYNIPHNATQLPVLPVPGTQPLSARIRNSGHAPVHGQDRQLLGQGGAQSPAAAESLHPAGYMPHPSLDEIAGPSTSQVRNDVF